MPNTEHRQKFFRTPDLALRDGCTDVVSRSKIAWGWPLSLFGQFRHFRAQTGWRSLLRLPCG